MLSEVGPKSPIWTSSFFVYFEFKSVESSISCSVMFWRLFSNWLTCVKLYSRSDSGSSIESVEELRFSIILLFLSFLICVVFLLLYLTNSTYGRSVFFMYYLFGLKRITYLCFRFIVDNKDVIWLTFLDGTSEKMLLPSIMDQLSYISGDLYYS